jgi:hypothetical protein
LEETWQLPVAVPTALHPYALADLIAHYGGVEKDVNVQCRNCGVNTPHDSRPSYLQTPRILVIQALRFVVPKTPEPTPPILINPSLNPDIANLRDSPVTPNDSAATDSDTTITKPRKRTAKRKVVKNPAHITFPLTRLDMTSYLRSESEENEEYDLFGVVEHVGRRMDGGHYIAYVRGRDSMGKDTWWKCNDGKCWIVGGEVVSSAQGYIWFYERQSQRGVVPGDWPAPIPVDVMDVGAKMVGVVENDGGLATPESDPVVERRRTQSESGARREESAWGGRLRGTSLDGGVTYFPLRRDG